MVVISDDQEETKSIFIVINKYFYVNNRTDFEIAGNVNRILAEDYIGLDYKVDRRYFAEGNDYGFLTFTNYNENKGEISLFYGTPSIQLVVDNINGLLLADGGSAPGVGTPKKVYNKIVSGDNTKYPINNSFLLSITSFYQQDYEIPIVLKNNDTTIANISLNLSRFAFGGNGGNLLLVDDKGINCKQQWLSPNCSANNTFLSTEYRGLYDTFYSDGTQTEIQAFEILKEGNNIYGHHVDHVNVYNRNLDFNPWAVAIFYSGDMVVNTKSFN